MDSLRRVGGSVGRGRGTVHVAAAPVALDPCVLVVGRHGGPCDPSSSELELVGVAASAGLASSNQICSSDSRRASEVVGSITTSLRHWHILEYVLSAELRLCWLH